MLTMMEVALATATDITIIMGPLPWCFVESEHKDGGEIDGTGRVSRIRQFMRTAIVVRGFSLIVVVLAVWKGAKTILPNGSGFRRYRQEWKFNSVSWLISLCTHTRQSQQPRRRDVLGCLDAGITALRAK